MKVTFEWRDPDAKYRWQFKEVELDVLPRSGDRVYISPTFGDDVTSVLWQLYDDDPRVEITLGDLPE